MRRNQISQYCILINVLLFFNILIIQSHLGKSELITQCSYKKSVERNGTAPHHPIVVIQINIFFSHINATLRRALSNLIKSKIGKPYHYTSLALLIFMDNFSVRKWQHMRHIPCPGVKVAKTQRYTTLKTKERLQNTLIRKLKLGRMCCINCSLR